jgi:transglutaminase-like putative cysteine protease
VPTSGGFQAVVGYEPPERTTAIVARPYDRPVHEWLGAAASLRLTARYRLRVQNQRVNPGLLRHVTWDDLRALPPELKPYLTPQAELAPHADEISAFVARSLPADYRTRMRPYATARRLFLAVVRQLKHKDPTAQPKGVLNSDRDDCGHYAGVYVACLQAAGLPARMVPGCWTSATDSAWHVWTEVWFPGHGWMMADPSEGAACDPSGTYAYRFGIVPNGNQRCALGRGAEATTDEASTSFLQVVNFWYTGAARVRTASTEIRHTLVDQTKGR